MRSMRPGLPILEGVSSSKDLASRDRAPLLGIRASVFRRIDPLGRAGWPCGTAGRPLASETVNAAGLRVVKPAEARPAGLYRIFTRDRVTHDSRGGQRVGQGAPKGWRIKVATVIDGFALTAQA